MDYRQPDLSVITVNYNGFHDTCEFIDSWVATISSVSYEMIVIDNGSTTNEAALLQKTYPFIQAVRSEQNLGFAGGNNLGINLAKGRYLFLLNNDVCMVKDTIPLLINRLLSSDKTAGVSPLIRDYTEPHAIQFAGYFPHYLKKQSHRQRRNKQGLLSCPKNTLSAWCRHVTKKRNDR